MEDNKKLLPYLKRMVFDTLILLLCFSCRHHGIEEYSILNKIDTDVELLLYFTGDPFDGNISEQYIILSGEYVKFLTMQTDDRGGFGPRYFIDRVDSVKLRIVGEDFFAAQWFSSGVFKYAAGYETLPDFFRTGSWSGKNIIQHGGSHAEYRFNLKLHGE